MGARGGSDEEWLADAEEEISQLHELAAADAAAAAPLVEFCSGLQWEGYKRMVLALEARLGPRDLRGRRVGLGAHAGLTGHPTLFSFLPQKMTTWMY